MRTNQRPFYGYTNVSFPTGYVPVEADVMSISYFDDYVWQTESAYNFDPSTAFHAQGLTKGLMTGMLSRNIETNDWLKTVNYFDYRAKLIQSFFKNHKGNIERSETQYRFNGEILKFRIEHEGINEIYEYEYNHLGNKKSFRHTKDGTVKNVSKYEYDEINRLKTKKLGSSELINSIASGSWNNTNIWQNSLLPTISDVIRINAGHNITINSGEAGSAGSLFNAGTLNTYGQLKLGVLPLNSIANDLQTVDYSYHIRGLRGINLDGNNNLTNKLFSMRLDYETAGFYDGNIGKQEWKSNIDNVKRSFTYSYDGSSRIKSGLYASDKSGENYSLNNVNYDFNGNITNLSRNGWRSDNTFGLIDNLNYTYNANSNKILKVDDGANDVASFSDVAGNDYLYNLDGSLISDVNKGISIEYNYLKKPKRITFSNNQTIEYQYDATGKKLREKSKDGIWTDYFGNLIYKANALYQIGIDEGRINAQNEYEYAIQDHLGNVRVMFRDSLGIAKITQSENFGVWGESLKKLNYYRNSTEKQQFVYTGHERHEELEVYDAKARFYDPTVPRFWQIDPLAEISKRWSPYNYTYNNPIRFTDPDGMAAEEHYEGAEAQEKFKEEQERSAQRNENADDKDKGKGQKNETSQGAYAHTLYSNISKNKAVVAGFTTGYNKDDKYGSVQGNITGFRTEGFDYSGTGKSNLAIEAGLKASGLQGTTSMRLGTENNNIQANTEGNALVGETNLSFGIFTGENSKKGVIVGAEAGVYGLRGEFNPSISVFGYKFGFTLGGSLGSAQVGAGLGAYRDTNKGTHHVNAFISGGFVVGGKVGFQIVIP